MNNITVHKLYDGNIIFTNNNTGEQKQLPKERAVHFYSTPASELEYLLSFASTLNELKAESVKAKVKKKEAEEVVSEDEEISEFEEQK